MNSSEMQLKLKDQSQAVAQVGNANLEISRPHVQNSAAVAVLKEVKTNISTLARHGGHGCVDQWRHAVDLARPPEFTV